MGEPSGGEPVSEEHNVIEDIARQVRVAVEAADLSAFSDLLDPDVHWGPPDDQSWGCHNRDQVLAWYRRGRALGVRAKVSEIAIHDERILVGLRVSGNEATQDGSGEVGRWQVLTVRDGRVVDIVGYDDRAEAAARAGLPPT